MDLYNEAMRVKKDEIAHGIAKISEMAMLKTGYISSGDKSKTPIILLVCYFFYKFLHVFSIFICKTAGNFIKKLLKEFFNRFRLFYNDCQSWITQGVKIADMIAEDFIRDYGGDAIPVVSNVEYEAVQSSGRRPVIVTNEIKEAIEKSNYSETVIVEEPKSVKELVDNSFISLVKSFSNMIASLGE